MIENSEDIYSNRRISLAFLGTIMQDLLDVGVVEHVQVTDCSCSLCEFDRSISR